MSNINRCNCSPSNCVYDYIILWGSGSRAEPIAIVVHDNGPEAQKLIKILSDSDAFKITMLTTEQQNADEALKQLRVAAVITIPGNFDVTFDTHKPDPVVIHINNLNLDFTNDLRRSLP